MSGRDRVEADELDRRDGYRIALGDRQGDIDGVLLVIELHVEVGDVRVGKPAILIKGLNALEVGIEARTVEVSFTSPWDFRALLGRQRVPEPRLVDRMDTLKLQTVDADGSFLFARRDHSHERNECRKPKT